MKNPTHLLLAGATSLTLLSGLAQAGSVNWGGAHFTNNYSSDGNPLAAASYELGIFLKSDGTEFLPTFQNIDEWEDRWVPFSTDDDGTTDANSEYDATENYFGGVISFGETSDQVQTVAGPDNSGKIVHSIRAYIWGYDTKDLGGQDQPEWFLVTGKDTSGGAGSTSTNWIVPDSTQSNNGTLDIQWEVSSSTMVIVGQTDDGAGGGTMSSPGGSFASSDHQFATIPEPGSTALLLLSALTLLRRKR